MKKKIDIHVTIDTETGEVIGLNVTEGLYNNCVFVIEQVDDPISIREATDYIFDELKYRAK